MCSSHLRCNTGVPTVWVCRRLASCFTRCTSDECLPLGGWVEGISCVVVVWQFINFPGTFPVSITASHKTAARVNGKLESCCIRELSVSAILALGPSESNAPSRGSELLVHSLLLVHRCCKERLADKHLSARLSKVAAVKDTSFSIISWRSGMLLPVLPPAGLHPDRGRATNCINSMRPRNR
jgi:hypothetical protein